MKREFLDYVEDILQTSLSIQKFVGGMSYDQFAADEKTVFAAIQGFEIIGEAVKHIPADIQQIYPEIPWSIMARMRDLLIHHYFETNFPVLWDTIQNRLPSLILEINKMIKDYNPLDDR
jgi:uncharacterized protein with HEPN domain